MTTPFRADDTIDEEALRAETRYLIETAWVVRWVSGRARAPVQDVGGSSSC